MLAKPNHWDRLDYDKNLLFAFSFDAYLSLRPGIICTIKAIVLLLGFLEILFADRSHLVELKLFSIWTFDIDQAPAIE